MMAFLTSRSLSSKAFVKLIFGFLLLSIVSVDSVPMDDPVMDNYKELREEGQGFFLSEWTFLYETPDSPLVPYVTLDWWCDLEFSPSSEDDNSTSPIGYVGRMLMNVSLGSHLQDAIDSGAQNPNPNSDLFPFLVSSVYVPSLNIFQGKLQNVNDNNAYRFWDDGSTTMELLGWEGHDEGHFESQSAHTSALVTIGTLTKISADEAAKYFNLDVSEMTPDKCNSLYAETWNATTSKEELEVSHLEDKIAEQDEVIGQLQADIKKLMSSVGVHEDSDSNE